MAGITEDYGSPTAPADIQKADNNIVNSGAITNTYGSIRQPNPWASGPNKSSTLGVFMRPPKVVKKVDPGPGTPA